MDKRLARALSPAAIVTATALSGALASGCGNDVASVTVQGHALAFSEQTYGASGGNSGSFCQPLDVNGQAEVVITDTALCGSLNAHSTNATAFHSSDATTLRLIFTTDPAVLKKVPSSTTFPVGTSLACKNAPSNNGEAVAFFTHNNGAMYDANVEADSGTITVNYFASPSNATGSFDLHFGGDHVVGEFNAAYCKYLTPALGL